MILFARWLLQRDGSVRENAGVVVSRGRIERVLRGRRALSRAGGGARDDLGEGLLAPGFVNAHAHLELTGLAGELPGDRGFGAWIGGILEARRRLRPRDYRVGVERGAQRLVETGTTTVGDIASTAAGAVAGRGPLRSVVYREVLDAWDPERTRAARGMVRRALPRRILRREGISPHAPYTTSAALLSAARAVARRRDLPVTVHWAETADEVEWMRSGGGPLAAVLPSSPRLSGLDLLEAAGLLDRRTSLAHGNHPGRGEPGRLAQRGLVLVHCPGTHAFFRRAPFPWARYRRAGVPIALGTDSAASNEDLDLRREMALLRTSQPGLAPVEVVEAATRAGARALGAAGEIGEIRTGAAADLVLHRLPAGEPLETLTHGLGRVAGVWVRGRRVVD